MTAIVAADPLSVMYVASNMREADKAEIYATRWTRSPIDLAEDICRIPGPKWIAHAKGAGPVAAYGAMPMWPGVWSLYLFATPHFLRVAGAVTRHIRRVMMPSLALAGAHRAEARSSAHHVEAHAWLERLGARREGVLKGYGRDGEDFISFVWDVETR
jgi:hypothetical protein